MAEDAAVTRSAGLIGFFTLLSRVLGMVRDIVVARFFGAGTVADAFFVAFSIPNMLRRLVGEGSLTVSFVPIFTEYLEKHGKEDALRLAHITFTLATIVLAGITLVGILLSRPLVMFMAPGFNEIADKIDITVRLTQLMFPYTFFICLVALAMGILNSFRHFTAPALAPVLLNVSMIACVAALHHRFSQPGMSLVAGVLLGGILQLALQVPYLRKFGVRLRFIFDFAHPALRRIGKLMLPSVFGVAVYQINLFVATIFVSPFPGGRSYIYYADRLIELPIGVFATAIGTAILPTLSRFSAQGDMKSLAGSVGYSIRLLAAVIIPAMVGLVILRVPVLNLIYERGEFTPEDTIGAASALLMFALGLWAFAGIRVVVPAYYSLKDAVTPVVAGFIAMLVNIAGCMTLPRYFDHAGVALSISIAAVVNFVLLILLISRKLPPLGYKKMFSSLGRVILACIPMGLVIYPVAGLETWGPEGTLIEKIMWMAVAVGGGMVVYVSFAWIFRLEELKTLIGIVRERLYGGRD